MSLQEPTRKMSKSDTDHSATIFLSDEDEAIRKKFKKAVTDSGSEITFDVENKPGVSNLLTIQSAVTGKSIDELVTSYAGKQYGHLKLETAEIAIECVRPIRDEYRKLLGDKKHLDAIFRKGAEQARQRAEKTLTRVKDALGFIAR